jgi:hypothetical protein
MKTNSVNFLMRHLIVFIVLLASSFFCKLHACGFYPWGEEVRFCYFKPYYFGFDHGYRYFNYTTDWYDYGFYEYNVEDEYYEAFFSGTIDYDPNIKEWSNYCNGKVDNEAIRQAIYKLSEKQLAGKSKNGMLKYLYKKKDYEAIDYILFAKQCEQFTWRNQNDPWEKQSVLPKGHVSVDELLKQAGERAITAKDISIKERYLFLKVRLSFYFGKSGNIKDIYETNFKNKKDKNLLYYWVLFFYTQIQTDQAKENYYAAQVFAHAPDKRFVVRSNYDRSIPIEKTLKFARTAEERANIYLLHGIRITSKGLPYIKEIYQNDPSSYGLGFMLVREINKMEDWILTPQYSLFEPSVRTDYWENNNAHRVLSRVKEDRKYAAEVLAFINTMDLSKIDNPDLVRLVQCYAAFLAQDNKTALKALNKLDKTIKPKNALYEPFKLVKGLVLVASQEKGQAVIPADVKPILIDQYKKGNHKYLFGIGRELEEKGNTTLAVLVFSMVNHENKNDDWLNTATWKTKNGVASLYSDFYRNYISYIDAGYTIDQMEALIADVNKSHNSDGFEGWLYSTVKNEKTELYKILGTKYLREDCFVEARNIFAKIDKNSEYVFNENPFYKIKDTPEFTADYDKKQQVSRVYIMDNLIKLSAMADNPNLKDRDYYCFLVANCHYNMGKYGNAWSMRRRFKGGHMVKNGFVDDDDFFGYKTARVYYFEAYRAAKTEKFKALCLRMMLQCEKYNLEFAHDQNWQLNYRYDLKPGENKYEDDLKKKYGKYYSELQSNCTAFSDYFKARR